MADLPAGAYRGGSLDCQIIYNKDDLPIGFSQRGVDTYFPSVNTNLVTGENALLVGGGQVPIGNPLSTVPAKPSNVIATASNASATVQFLLTKPVPTSVTVTATPGGQSVTVAATAPNMSVTVPGLTNGTAYSFTVASTNPVGTGPSSAASNSVTPTATPSTVLPVTRGLEFWWSAALAASPGNGNPLTSLVDMSGNGYHAAARGTPNPLWVSSWSNGKPAVALNPAVSNYFDCNATGFFGGMRGENFTAYVLYDITATTNAAARILSLERPTPQTDVTLGGFAMCASLGSAGTAKTQIVNNAASYAGPTFSGPDVTYSIPTIATVTGPGALRVNGSPVTGFVDGRIKFATPGTPWTFGCMYAGGYNKYMAGRIAEIIIFSAVHSPAEILAVETYLATRI